MSLAGRVALVVGGGTGIGAAAARRLAQDGATVAITYLRNDEAAKSLRESISAEGGRAEIFQSDAHDPDEVGKLVGAVHAIAGRLDVVVLSAPGQGGLFQPLLSLDWDAFISFTTSKLKAAHAFAKAAIPLMTAQGGGRLIFVSSGWATYPNMPGLTNLSAGFAAEVGFLKALAVEVGRSNITVNAVTPGMVETELSANLSDEVRRQVVTATPLGRIAVPDDIAGVISFLASDASRFMTGTCLPVSGGLATQ
jgi:3-oxoacyl-[acyl-carrier protein] reductase